MKIVCANSPAHACGIRASIKIVYPAILLESFQPALGFRILLRQKCNLAVRSLDRARLASASRGRNSAVHSRSESGVRLSYLCAFPSGVIASVPDVFLDEIDVVQYRVQNVFFRGDRELAAIKS
jgi:hypothetical protein